MGGFAWKRRDAKVSEACIFWLSYPFVDRLNKEGILKALTELAAEKVEPHVVPGREMKAQYAFDDLWEAQHGAA